MLHLYEIWLLVIELKTIHPFWYNMKWNTQLIFLCCKKSFRLHILLTWLVAIFWCSFGFLRFEIHPNADKQYGNDMTRKVDAPPVSNGILPSEQQETHAHVIKPSHLEEPCKPVIDDLLLWWLAIAECCLHSFLSYHAQWNSKEAEVITTVYAMPIGTDWHCNGNTGKWFKIRFNNFFELKEAISVIIITITIMISKGSYYHTCRRHVVEHLLTRLIQNTFRI